jgi:predicted metal-binding membrane protein
VECRRGAHLVRAATACRSSRGCPRRGAGTSHRRAHQHVRRVTSVAIDPARLSVAPARRLLWRHPEWWSIALGLAAWIALLLLPRHSASHQSTAINLIFWLLMVVAMMFPLVMAQVRQAAFHSLWSRRHRAIGFFLTGYVLPWLAFGALFILVQRELAVDRRASVLIAAILIAAAWQASPSKRRALSRCHRIMPLAPRGWRANWDCLRFGWRIGTACVCACWALMLVCAVSDHSLLTMCGATIVAIYDRSGVVRLSR